MVRRSVNYCIIDYNSTDGNLRVRGLAPLGPVTEFGSKIVPDSQLRAECNEYWKFVDTAIESKELTSGEEELQGFYDTLMTRGTTLSTTLMDFQTRQNLWSLARQSDVLILVTSLLQVPWEALFNPDIEIRTFLAHECIITRWPEMSSNHGAREVLKKHKFAKDRIVLLDSLLADMMHFDLCIEAIFKSDGEEVSITSSKSVLVDAAREFRLIHWICEHESKGLRLRKNHHYTSDDAATHLFPNGSVLMLTSCRAGSGNSFDGNIAARICAASNCTVIAPSSVVATHVGVEFARKLNLIVSNTDVPLKVSDLWQKVQGTRGKGQVERTPVTVEKCFALWYGIYGNADHFVKG